jgi:hypothetical protein
MPQAEIGKLNVRITASAAEMQAELQRAERVAKQFGANVNIAIAKGGGGGEGLGGFTKFGLAMAGIREGMPAGGAIPPPVLRPKADSIPNRAQRDTPTSRSVASVPDNRLHWESSPPAAPALDRHGGFAS